MYVFRTYSQFLFVHHCFFSKNVTKHAHEVPNVVNPGCPTCTIWGWLRKPVMKMVILRMVQKLVYHMNWVTICFLNIKLMTHTYIHDITLHDMTWHTYIHNNRKNSIEKIYRHGLSMYWFCWENWNRKGPLASKPPFTLPLRRHPKGSSGAEGEQVPSPHSLDYPSYKWMN